MKEENQMTFSKFYKGLAKDVDKMAKDADKMTKLALKGIIICAICTIGGLIYALSQIGII